MTEQVDTTLKVVVEATTRPQAGENQMRNWTSGIEGWAAGKVTELVESYTGTAALDDSKYRMKITDGGLDPDLGGERLWELYPKQTVTVTVDDEDAWHTHLDAYYRDLQAEIRTQLDSAPVAARMTILRWHMHLDGSTDEVEL